MSHRAVECECGEVLTVPADVGKSLKCSCARFVLVPADEEFASGRVVLSAPTVELRIKRLISAGMLPPSSECAWCGAAEAKPLDIRLVCEQAHSRTTGGTKFLYLPGLFWMTWEEERRTETFGRDTTVPVPLCACAACAREHYSAPPRKLPLFPVIAAMVLVPLVIAAFSPVLALVVGALALLTVFVVLPWRRQNKAARRNVAFKEKLGQVPVYAQLLRDYPRAVVVIRPWIWRDRRPRRSIGSGEVD